MLKYLYTLIILTYLSSHTQVSAQDFKGKATTYTSDVYGDTTITGDVIAPQLLTASHEYFSMGTIIEIKNLKNNKSVQVVINDNEISDPSFSLEYTEAVGKALCTLKDEIIDVKITIISWGNKTGGNIAINSKKENDFKVDFRKYDYIKTNNIKKN
jgi:hypothetical protein